MLYSALSIAYLLAACAPVANAQLSAARNRWTSANIRHYRYLLTVSCFCAFSQKMPLTIEVKDGAPVSMQYNDGSPVSAGEQQIFASYQTIDALFDFTSDSLARADAIKIAYDPTYGFPSAVQIDFIKNAMDDELSLYVKELQPLP